MLDRRLVGPLAAALLAALLAGPAVAALQRVEAVGSYGIRESLRSEVIPRDEAIQAALWEAVSRVALELLGESAGLVLEPEDAIEDEIGGETEGEAGQEDAVLRKALGEDMLPYTRRFQILEDKGEVPVLFAEEPEISLEYVIVVEVLVDGDRVQAALAAAGLVEARPQQSAGEPVLVELQGIRRYPAFEAVLAALRSELGARRVEALGFARGRQLVSIEGRLGPRELSAALARLELESVSLEPYDVDETSRRIRVRATRREASLDGLDVLPPSIGGRAPRTGDPRARR